MPVISEIRKISDRKGSQIKRGQSENQINANGAEDKEIRCGQEIFEAKPYATVLKIYDEDSNSSTTEKSKSKPAPRASGSRKATKIYDGKGLLIDSKADLCDCLDQNCPGCFFSCYGCNGFKCGITCRNYRTWMYTKVISDGQPNQFINPHCKENINP